MREHAAEGLVLAFEIGYKYVFYGEHARLASALLGTVAFVKRDGHLLQTSVPTHRLRVHLRRLVAAGHAVGVVTQTETAAVKARGAAKSAPFRRELTARYSRATLAAAPHLPGDADDLGDSEGDDAGATIVCVAELPGVAGGMRLGIVAAAPSTGNLDRGTAQPAHDGRAAWGGGPFGSDDSSPPPPTGDAPTALASLLAGAEAASVVASMPPAAQSALVGLLSQLRRYGLESVMKVARATPMVQGGTHVQLGANAITHLDVFVDAGSGRAQGSLLHAMDTTVTVAGRRCLRSWLAQPLTSRPALLARQAAAAALASSADGGPPPLGKLLPRLRSLPDLERGLMRVTHGTATPAECALILGCLSGLGRHFGMAESMTQSMTQSMTESMTESQTESLTQSMAAPALPPMPPLLTESFAAAFHPGAAAAASRLLSWMDPSALAPARPGAAGWRGGGGGGKGGWGGPAPAKAADPAALLRTDTPESAAAFPALAIAKAAAATAAEGLESLLPGIRRELRQPGQQFKTVSQVTHLIEVKAGTAVPRDWVRMSTTKTLERYHPPAVARGLESLAFAAETLAAAGTAAWKIFLGLLGAHAPTWLAAARALAAVDALQCLGALTRRPGWRLPTLLPESDPPTLRLGGLRHAVLDSRDGSQVPNDVALSGASGEPRAFIVTGPNMAGKSVLSKAVCLAVLLAQIGSAVPASSDGSPGGTAPPAMSVLDGLFTRVGAGDDLAHGRSTFLEEMGEAAETLRGASPRSLVFMDELGRGTATADGLAIAWAAASCLLARGCLLLFATHFPSLASGLAAEGTAAKAVTMAYLVEETGESRTESRTLAGTRARDSTLSPAASLLTAGGGAAASSAAARLVFLYTLTPGVASCSFGLNVARIAGVGESILVSAEAHAHRLQGEHALRAAAAAAAGSGVMSAADARVLAAELGGAMRGLESVIRGGGGAGASG